MPRQPRIEFSGAFYHVMARGNRREFLFEKEETKILIIRTLGEAAVRFRWKIHAYAIMDNHYHLLLETPEANLVAGMTWFQTAFTVRCNRQNGQCGHVFAGRYKSVLVQSKSGPYLSRLITYIHLNPVRAGIFPEQDGDFLHAHRWTSLYWLNRDVGKGPSWYTTERYLPAGALSKREQSRGSYLQMLEGIAWRDSRESGCVFDTTRETLDMTLSRGWVYGDIAFREEMRSLIKETPSAPLSHQGDVETANACMALAERNFALTREEIRSKKKSSPEKIALGMLIKERTGMSHRDIANYLNMGHPVRSARLINEALKEKLVDTPISKCYSSIMQNEER